MLITLWIVNGLLALGIVAPGFMKLTRAKAALAESGMDWVEDFSAGMIKLIAALEVLGAIGLIVPLLLDIAPVLTPLAAVGIIIIMIGAVVLHVRRKENFVAPLILALLAAVSAVLGFLVVLS